MKGTLKNRGFKILQISFIAFIIISSFISCQKEITEELSPSTTTPDTTPATQPGYDKVKTYTEEISSSGATQIKDSFNLTYDENERILSIISATTPGNQFLYKYSSDNTYTMDIYESNVLSIREVFFLNNLPLVDSTIQFEDGQDTTTEKYLYNSNKQIVSLKQYDYFKAKGSVLYNTTNYTYDNMGNVIKEVDSTSTVTYDYYPDLVNNLSVGLIYFSRIKNLIKTTTHTTRGRTTITNHTYTFDNKNRISSEKAVTDNGEMYIIKYTYY